ncbi:hypothetical protein [Runella sp.]
MALIPARTAMAGIFSTDGRNRGFAVPASGILSITGIRMLRL